MPDAAGARRVALPPAHPGASPDISTSAAESVSLTVPVIVPSAGEFISERLQPAGDTFARPPAIGEPALPLRFAWRKQTFEVAEVLARRKEYDADRTHGSGERYLRRHWFELRLTDGSRWSVYFQRQPGSRRSARSRWWLYQVLR